MKEIALPLTQTFSLTLDTHKVDTSQAVDLGDGRFGVPLGNVIGPTIMEAMETARRNGGTVLYATTSLEQKMEDLLLRYFMGPFMGHENRRVMFEREILQSSALSFKAKKDLVVKVVNDAELLSGKRKNSLQGHMKRVMDARNAFAHGTIQHETTRGCFLKYYSGEPRTQTLSDDYWEGLEETYRKCDELLGAGIEVLTQLKASDPASAEALEVGADDTNA